MEISTATHSESEYNEILRQAVAVIETAKNKAARAIVGSPNEMHWEIGKPIGIILWKDNVEVELVHDINFTCEKRQFS